ncbi:DUF4388 domain-containing protein [Candidatus Thiothrix anitrata]|jgi:hypothetical protein|uniref:DUF4388 domain-containing protein n=1 Tax=Candidatus Thiothrix anitrata TaxID=2823902 RepID=A0ABX7X5B1_9GAMM|nr:DUF4388 domain-containing protein [Candidatus Thiothrix anitrata]QTR50547.1 DUF4388 domain-containing protein [Candidatus Thiothrix anitrata]
MENNPPLTLTQILARLSQILGQKQSGTFFVATDRNTSCRFALETGKITHCTHGRDQGMNAVRSFLETHGGSCSFSENQFVPFRTEAGVSHQMCMDVLGIRPSIRIEKPPLLASSPASTRTKGADSRFYRGGYVPTESGAAHETATQTAKVDNRFYRGG